MPRVKNPQERLPLFQELSKAVPHTGTISHVPGRFLGDLRKFLAFTDDEAATLFQVSRANVSRKRAQAEKMPDVPTPSGPDGMGLEQLMRGNLTAEEELEFLRNYGWNMFTGMPNGSQQKVALFKLLVEHGERKLKEETEEGKGLLVSLMQEVVQILDETQTRVEQEFRQQLRSAIDTLIADAEADPGGYPETKKAALLNQGGLFDVKEIAHGIALRKPAIMEQVQKYLSRGKDRPSLRGGGVVKDSVRDGKGAKKGGAQYRQAKRREKRQKER